MKLQATKLRNIPQVTARDSLQLLGHMALCTFVLQNARLYMRCFQAWLATVYKPNMHSLNKPLSIPFQVKDSLLWSTVPSNLCSGVPFLQTAPSLIMATDACLTGWGAHISHHTVHGLWSTTETSLHINVLELQAIRTACRHFLPLIKNQHVRIMTDNIACMFYVNRQGGARSHSLCSEAMKLWNWCLANHIHISAAYLPGVMNTTAQGRP